MGGVVVGGEEAAKQRTKTTKTPAVAVAPGEGADGMVGTDPPHRLFTPPPPLPPPSRPHPRRLFPRLRPERAAAWMERGRGLL